MTLFLIWSDSRGYFAAPDPLPVRIAGYEGALLFVDACQVDGRQMFAGYEGRAGHRLTDPELTIGSAHGALIALTTDPKQDGRAVPMTRATLDAKVAQAHVEREAAHAPVRPVPKKSAIKTAARVGASG